MRHKPHLPLDDYARKMIAEQPHCIVAWWLMASYVYYHSDETILTDGYFDRLCTDMLARWDDITHPHKHLIDRAALVAGTGFAIREADYPSITVDAACRLVEEPPPSRATERVWQAVNQAREQKPVRRWPEDHWQGELF